MDSKNSFWWQSFHYQGTASYIWWRKLRDLKGKLRIWNKEKFGKVETLIQNRVNQIDELDKKGEDGGLNDDEETFRQILKDELVDLQRKKEISWRQKARVRWRVEGENNTSYYHQVANGRSKNNGIYKLLINGVEVEDSEVIEDHIVGYYKDLYSTDFLVRPTLDGLVFEQLQPDQSSKLEECFSEEEVLYALKELGGERAPGPDGMPMVVFQKCWSFFKHDVMAVFKEFAENGFLDWRVNTTFVTLIPKKVGAISLGDFRPISLIGGIYKIISKTMSIRLRKVLPDLISQFQSAFVGRRQILDGILVANECLDSRRKAKERGLLIKVDIAKAYDCIQWEFIEYMLWRLGFGEKWRRWIKVCISTASFSILIDGSPKGHFKSQRGIRQGDPISPLIFTIVMEGLTKLVLKACDRGYLSGFKAAPTGPEVTVLQFADDTLVMCDASSGHVLVVKAVFIVFEAVSGLRSNMKKTKMMAVGHVPNINQLANLLGCEVGPLPCYYLGMPLGSTVRQASVWDHVVERVQIRLGGWLKQHVSTGGRLILIQGVLSQLPVYQMSVLVIPKKVSKRIETRISQFLWGSTETKRKFHLINWMKVCSPRDEGGLGLRRLDLMNRALMTSWLWRFGSEGDSLWKNVVVRKYGAADQGWWPGEVNQPYGCGMWRSIMHNWVDFKKGVKCKLGNGSRIRFWQDLWLGNQVLKERFPRMFLLSEIKLGSIADMASREGEAVIWNLQIRRELFVYEQQEMDNLMNLLAEVQFEEEDDRWIWKWAKNGKFSVRSMYKSLFDNSRGENAVINHFPSDVVWKKKMLPLKIKFFFWCALLGRSLTVDRLIRLGKPINPVCARCKMINESISHLFLHCARSLEVWEGLMRPRASSVLGIYAVDTLEEWLIAWPTGPDSELGNIVWEVLPYAIIWNLWKRRNRVIFRQQEADLESMCAEIKGVETFTTDMIKHRVTVKGRIPPEKLLKKLKKQTGKKVEIVVPNDASKSNAGDNDKKESAPVLFDDWGESSLFTMFSDENPNACSIM